MPQVERFEIRNSHEWALIYIDEEKGAFCCQSSFGDYAYIWRAIGSRSLKHFLAGLDFDYFMNKARPAYRTFDADKSVESVKRAIIDCRRHDDCTKAEAREAWNDLEYIETDNDNLFCDGIGSSDALRKILGDEYYYYAEKSPDGNSRGFWERIWPGFLEQAKEQVAA